jgi:hypothetical protein
LFWSFVFPRPSHAATSISSTTPMMKRTVAIQSIRQLASKLLELVPLPDALQGLVDDF